MFKLVSTSRKKGLLKSNLNIGIIAVLMVCSITAVVTLTGAIGTASTPLNLRYSTTTGPYDRGDWTRLVLVVIFVLVNMTTTVFLAHRLLPFKRPNLATALLVVGLIVSVIVLIISLQYAAYSQI